MVVTVCSMTRILCSNNSGLEAVFGFIPKKKAHVARYVPTSSLPCYTVNTNGPYSSAATCEGFQTRALILISCQANVYDSIVARGLQCQCAESDYTQQCTGCFDGLT